MDPMLGSDTSPQDTNMSPDITYQEVAATLATLRTLVKEKRKRQTPMYFRTRKIQRVRQGKPQTLTKSPISIEESPKKDDEIRIEEGKVQEVTSPVRTLVTYIRRHSSRLASHRHLTTLKDP